MEEWNCPMTLTTPGPTVTFNAAAPTNTLWNDPESCGGLESPDLRVPTAPTPRGHGIVRFPTLEEAFHITLAGTFLIHNTGDIAARNAMVAALRGALRILALGQGTLSWTPTTTGAQSLNVTVDASGKLKVTSLSGTGGMVKRYEFGLLGWS